MGVCIANGRVGSDRGIGNVTCDGKSLIDYMLISPELFPHVKDFRVKSFDCNYSDKHNPLLMAFKLVDSSVINNLIETSEPFNVKPAERKIRWDDDKHNMFNVSLNPDNVKLVLSQLNELDRNDVAQ
jgi:hypothetical protein